MFSVIFTDLAKSQLSKLNENVKQEIANKLRKISINPKKELMKLEKCEYYYFRISVYRIIMNLKEKELIVEVIRMGHRGFIYKEMGI
jgi:mRNA interferase RelE/StbE